MCKLLGVNCNHWSLTSCQSIVTLSMFITKTNVNLFQQPVIYKCFKSFKGYNFCTPIEMQVPNSCPTKNESDQTLVLSKAKYLFAAL